MGDWYLRGVPAGATVGGRGRAGELPQAPAVPACKGVGGKARASVPPPHPGLPYASPETCQCLGTHEEGGGQF